MVRIILTSRAEDCLQQFRDAAGDSKPNRMLMDAVLERIEWLKKNPQLGIRVPKRQVPKKYLRDDISAVLLLKLPMFWRMLYTVRRDEEKIVLILDILSHPEYDALFGYRKKT